VLVTSRVPLWVKSLTPPPAMSANPKPDPGCHCFVTGWTGAGCSGTKAGCMLGEGSASGVGASCPVAGGGEG
jgi:hypothetical protein